MVTQGHNIKKEIFPGRWEFIDALHENYYVQIIVDIFFIHTCLKKTKYIFWISVARLENMDNKKMIL